MKIIDNDNVLQRERVKNFSARIEIVTVITEDINCKESVAALLLEIF